MSGEGSLSFFVFSNAGYGQSTRGRYNDKESSENKAKRLLKKGHTDVEICEMQLIRAEKINLED